MPGSIFGLIRNDIVTVDEPWDEPLDEPLAGEAGGASGSTGIVIASSQN
jgi:hypothetical protein